jgi:hypothetical protein
MTSADKVKTATCCGDSFGKVQQDRSPSLLKKKQHRLLYPVILVSSLHFIDRVVCEIYLLKFFFQHERLVSRCKYVCLTI